MSTLWLGLLGFCAVASLAAWCFCAAGKSDEQDMSNDYWRDM